MRRPGVEGRNGVRRGDKKPPGTRTCNCKMDQEARAGIVGASVLPPRRYSATAAYTTTATHHTASLPTFLWLQIAYLITPLHSPDAQSVNSGDRLIAAIAADFCLRRRDVGGQF